MKIRVAMIAAFLVLLTGGVGLAREGEWGKAINVDNRGGFQSGATNYTGPLIVSSPQPLSGTSVTVGQDTQLILTSGASFYSTSGSGTTLNFHGPFDASLFAVLNVSGNATAVTPVWKPGSVAVVYPQWYGMKGDRSVDCSPLFLRMLESLNASDVKTVFFPDGTYRFDSGVTIPAYSSKLTILGNRSGVTLDFTSATGNGIAFAGEADNFTIKGPWLYSSGGSTGRGIYSNQASTLPLRNPTIQVDITGFLSGIHIEGSVNVNLDFTRPTGQGKAVSGGVGVLIGKDSSYGSNHVSMRNGYVASYEQNIYNKYAGTFQIRDTIVAAGVTNLRTGPSAITNADGMYFDSSTDCAIHNDGYTYWSGTVAAGTIYSSNQRLFRRGFLPSLVIAYLSGNSTIPSGAPFIVPYDTEEADAEGQFSSGTTYAFTAPYPGFYRIRAATSFRVSVGGNQQYTATILANSATIATHNHYSGVTAVPANMTVPVERTKWLDSGTTVEVYFRHDEGVDGTINGGVDDTYLTVEYLTQ